MLLGSPSRFAVRHVQLAVRHVQLELIAHTCSPTPTAAGRVYKSKTLPNNRKGPAAGWSLGQRNSSFVATIIPPTCRHSHRRCLVAKTNHCAGERATGKRWTSTTSPPLPPHRSGSHRKEMDIHYVAPNPSTPPPLDFGQSDRVREPDPKIAQLNCRSSRPLSRS